MYTVYKHTAPNGKVYIGITGQKPEKRWQNGSGHKRNKHLYSAIRKYGWENFKHEIICQAPMNAAQAGAVEKSFTALYDSANPDKGYNHSAGGECGALGVRRSAETCRKLSESHKGKTPWNKWKKGQISPNKGKHLSPETRRRLSEARKGANHPNYGRHLSAETRRKTSEASKGKHRSPEARRKMSESHKGKAPSNQKAVICVETGILYSSGTEAAKSIGVTQASISCVLRGVTKTSGGYHWIYAE